MAYPFASRSGVGASSGGSGSGPDFGQRIAAVKAGLTFGDAAGALGLKGSSRAGWDCPACASPNCLKERMDRRGARCTVCRLGFDVPGLVMRHQGEGAVAALAWCEAQIRAREAKPEGPGLCEFDPRTPGASRDRADGSSSGLESQSDPVSARSASHGSGSRLQGQSPHEQGDGAAAPAHAGNCGEQAAASGSNQTKEGGSDDRQE